MLRSFNLLHVLCLIACIVSVSSTCNVNELSTYVTVPSGTRTSSNVLSSNQWQYNNSPPNGPYLDRCTTGCSSSVTVLISMETVYNVFYIKINNRYLLSDYTWSAVTTAAVPNNVMYITKDTPSTLNGANKFLVGYNNGTAPLNSRIWGFYQPEYAFNFPYWNCPATPSATADNIVVTGNIIPANTVPSQYNVNGWPCGQSWTVWTLTVRRYCPSWVRGDPQFVGLRGQDYQVHGIDGGIYNLVSAPTYSINSRFVWLTGPRACPIIPSTGKKSVACFQHKGSYLANLAIAANGGKDQILIESGSATDGLSKVSVNGNEVSVGAIVDFGAGQSLVFNSTHEVSLRIGAFDMDVENSDGFVNLAHVGVKSSKWADLRSDDVHGLLGQTWKSASLKNKRVIEGIVDDYLIESNKLFGFDFMYNRFGKVSQ